MKEPLPYARTLIDRVAAERMAAETERDYAFPKAVAVLFGTAATIAVLVAAELFGPVGALAAIATGFAAVSRAKGGPA